MIDKKIWSQFNLAMPKIKCSDCAILPKCAFNKLNSEELDALDEIKSTHIYKRGDYLNQKGLPADGLYCLKDGFAKIIWPNANFQKESIVKIAGNGDFTGYRCLFSEKAFRATAVVLHDLEACFIPKDFFLKLIEKNKHFNMEILNLMGSEIRRAEERLHSFCNKNVREHLAECLIYLNNICGKKIENFDRYVLNIKLSRGEIASLIGVAKETAVRTLTDFKEEGLITQQENIIIIERLDLLVKLSNNHRE